jgi:hypothetical protein
LAALARWNRRIEMATQTKGLTLLLLAAVSTEGHGFAPAGSNIPRGLLSRSAGASVRRETKRAPMQL